MARAVAWPVTVAATAAAVAAAAAISGCWWLRICAPLAEERWWWRDMGRGTGAVADNDRPRSKMGGGARHLLCLACVADGPGQSWGGGSGACFTRVAWLALVGIGMVLGVLCWWGNWQQFWFGMGAGALAGRQCCGVSGGTLGQWHDGRAIALWCQHAGVRGRGTQQST